MKPTTIPTPTPTPQKKTKKTHYLQCKTWASTSNSGTLCSGRHHDWAPTQGWGSSSLCITWPPLCFVTASPSTAHPFLINNRSALSCLNHLGEKISLRVGPDQILPAQMPVITGETRAQSSAWLLWAVSVTKGNPRAYPAQFSTSQYWQAQQFLIGTLRSSIENKTKLMQVSQRELQQGRPELKDSQSFNCWIFPQAFWFVKFCFFALSRYLYSK